MAHGPKSEFTIHSMIAAMVGRDIEQLYPDRTSPPGAEVALEVRQLSKAGIVHHIDLTLHKGEVLGVFGLMGSGRSELAQIIFGLDDFDEGQILIDGQPVKELSPTRNIRNGMAFVTENRREEGLMMEATVADNLALAALPAYSTRFVNAVRSSSLATAVRETVDILSIKVNDAFRNEAKGLSGGNQQKVVLGKWLMTKPIHPHHRRAHARRGRGRQVRDLRDHRPHRGRGHRRALHLIGARGAAGHVRPHPRHGPG